MSTATATATAAAPAGSLAQTARAVQRRFALRGWMLLLARSGPWLFSALVATWLALRWSGLPDRAAWALAAVFLWLCSTAVLAWVRRPSPFAALVSLDAATAGEHGQLLASAWYFEQSGDVSPGARLHLQRAQEQLQQHPPQLARHFRLQPPIGAAVLAVLFLALSFSSWLRRAPQAEDLGLSAEARSRAQEVGLELKSETRVLDPLKELTPKERQEIDELQEAMRKVAEALKEKQTPRNLLEDLERQARAAERQAEALKGESLAELSSSFLSELESNSDTAELGNAARAEDLGRAAEEAKLLWARLGSRKPTLEEEKRLEEALKRALGKSSARDRQSQLGEAMSGAQRELGRGNSAAAAEQFRRLGERLGRAAQRQQAQNRLRGLAQSFRGAGQRILGGQGLQRLAPGMPSGSQPLAVSPQGGLGQSAPGQSLVPMPNGNVPLAPPSAPSRQGRGGAFPIPGGRATANAPTMIIPGTGGNKPGAGFTMPGGGSMPGGSVPMPGGGNMAGGFPVPGAGMGPGGSMAGPAAAGGTQAGRGTAALQGGSTTPLAAQRTAQVTPGTAAQGPSEVRAVEAPARSEAAARSSREIAVDFLKTEEAALAEEPLPPSRREEVLRYFTTLRNRFEAQP